jgi:hypothetical protein
MSDTIVPRFWMSVACILLLALMVAPLGTGETLFSQSRRVALCGRQS